MDKHKGIGISGLDALCEELHLPSFVPFKALKKFLVTGWFLRPRRLMPICARSGENRGAIGLRFGRWRAEMGLFCFGPLMLLSYGRVCGDSMNRVAWLLLLWVGLSTWRKIFFGLRSLWTTPSECIAQRPSRSWATRGLAWDSVRQSLWLSLHGLSCSSSPSESWFFF